MALRALIILSRSGIDPRVPNKGLSKSAKGEIKWSFGIQLFSVDLQRCLCDLLLDPFEDVRQDAHKLLQLFSSTYSISDKGGIFLCDREVAAIFSEGNLRQYQWKQQGATLQILTRAQVKMLHSGRVDHADGVARIFSLLAQNAMRQSGDWNIVLDGGKGAQPYSALGALIQYLTRAVEDALSVAKTSMSAAVEHHPVHGLFTALRYALTRLKICPQTNSIIRYVLSSVNEAPRQVADDHNYHPFEPFIVVLEKLIFDSWGCVRGLLCNDAPEGFLPEDMEETVDITTKDFLSYAWRALKESRCVPHSTLCFSSMF